MALKIEGDARLRIGGFLGMDVVECAPLFHPTFYPTYVLNLTDSNNIPLSTFAIQVLSRIGNKSVIQPLINKLGAGDKDVAQTAYSVLKGMTRSSLNFKWSADKDQRDIQVQEWTRWWKNNSEKIDLII